MTDRRRAPAPAHGPVPTVTGNVQAPTIRAELQRMSKAAKRSLEDVTETWTERAAIREYLGGMPRNIAEGRAVADTSRMLGLVMR